MKKIILLANILMYLGVQAQNLVNNPGFESYSALPATYGQYNLAIGWENCSGGGTPDYFNTAGTVGLYFGTNLPHTGDGMCGFCPYHGSSVSGFREYLSTALSSPMVAGQTYSVSFWLASGINGGYGYGCNNVGVAFSSGPLTQSGTGPILINPQIEITTVFYDTVWTQFSFQYTATSAFDYFTIGNFRDDANTTAMQFGVPYDGVYYFVDDITVEISNQPPVAIFNAANHICPGTCTNFTNLSQNATSFLWTFAGASPSTSTDVNPVNICYNTPGSYTVTLVATNAITSDTLSLLNYITVYPYPAPQGILQNGDTLFANQGAVSYQWYQDGVLISGATGYYYVALQSGDYNVVCTDANGCEVEAVIFNVVASVTASGTETEAVVYPNPAMEKLIISSGKEIKGLSIYNVLGEKIEYGLFTVSTTGRRAEINIAKLSPGTYCVEISDGKNKFRKTFIKA